eukprot:CAMPEP_0198734648 /NCGR_PEP_ID=MMETSP1475-20131203/54173_1 /TAXON_ID= ORGANISM="Unidentified sp., Strain CCMP1999" /NCGR_SAMPLE_ID=MMETSP1475 /ASSEMBLY_ACC=CAM_ASM_001111 /LENGTH=542 /DNA_ID=CAMNT_0044498161 /DNA_START=121 /DNA_END=1746 /DNA_ORIENTATION=-
MGELASGLAYANFRAWVPRKRMPVGTAQPKTWTFFDWGPTEYPEPLLFLHDAPGAADVFFQQVLELGARGYRVIAAELPAYWSVREFVDGLQLFLDMNNIRKVHIYGAGLGGYLAMQFATQRPELVGSLALTHAYLRTEKIRKTLPHGAVLIRWLPDFAIRRSMLELLPNGRVELNVALAIEFIIARIQETSRELLASRLALMCSSEVVKTLKKADYHMTIVDALDRDNRGNEEASREIAEVFPRARVASIKHGGEFVYLSHADEVNVHLVVHMRRTAPTPEIIPRLPLPAKARIANPAEARKLREVAREDHLSPNFKFVKELQSLKASFPDADIKMLTSAVSEFSGNSDLVRKFICDGAINIDQKGPLPQTVIDQLKLLEAKDSAEGTPKDMRVERALANADQHEHSQDYISRGPGTFQRSYQPNAERSAAEKETSYLLPKLPVGADRFQTAADDDEEANPLLVVAEKVLGARENQLEELQLDDDVDKKVSEGGLHPKIVQSHSENWQAVGTKEDVGQSIQLSDQEEHVASDPEQAEDDPW